jgi:hypothetical protein
MNYAQIREQAKWYVLLSGLLFLAVSTYLRVKFGFESGNVAGALLLASMILAGITLLLGLFSLPRWQAWLSLAICAYALYWLLFTRPYVIID